MSTTPTTRRTFLGHTLAALATGPLLVKGALDQKPALKNLADNGWTTAPRADLYGASLRAIKVPSNRYHHDYATVDEDPVGHYYHGAWDGTFKLEHGCANPAYILADLIERSLEGPDWVTGIRVWMAGCPMARRSFALNWQMLYDWGRACDEPATQVSTVITFEGTVAKAPYLPCMSVDAPLWTMERATELRERLRMFCLSWQSTDPRYRTSWPGIPYPFKEGAA